MNFYYLMILAAGIAVGCVIGLLIFKYKYKDLVCVGRERFKKLEKQAIADAERIRKDAQLKGQEEVFRLRREEEREIKEQRNEFLKLEKRVLQKEELIERKEELIDKKELEIREKAKWIDRVERDIKKKDEDLKGIHAEQVAMLEKISGMTAGQAKEYLLKKTEEDAWQDAGKLLKKIETETREKAEKKANEIISLAISRYAGEYVAEKTVSVVPIPSDEMKGRIIGREGRNIRTLEAATGMDFIIDDTPEAVIISGFNPVRREVARIALERLVADGRIHPSRIEEMVRKAEVEVDAAIKEAGEQAAFDVGVYRLNPELIKLLGRLKFRTSYGQNVLQHSLEVAFLCGVMASELRINVKRAKRAGLLHDIGKAVDHEMEGPHAMLGGDLARKFGEHPDIVHAISAHHEDVSPESVLDVLVQAADALSGARPGARRETLESYVKRLEDIETIARSFSGVQKSFAMQAGREIRIMVESDKITDEGAAYLSKEVAKKIENELTYPGQIKVTVIRETRAVEIAK
jgi:ribonuclease Y